MKDTKSIQIIVIVIIFRIASKVAYLKVYVQSKEMKAPTPVIVAIFKKKFTKNNFELNVGIFKTKVLKLLGLLML